MVAGNRKYLHLYTTAGEEEGDQDLLTWSALTGNQNRSYHSYKNLPQLSIK